MRIIHTGDRIGLSLRVSTALAVVGLALALPAFAAASDPTSAQYEDTAAQINNSVEQDKDTEDKDTAEQVSVSNDPTAGGGGEGGVGGGPLDDQVVGGLPFTGLDIVVIAVLGAVLIGTGLLLRRLSAGTRS